MLKKLTDTTKLVEHILKNCPEARDSFNILFQKVVEIRNPDALRLSLKTVLQNMNALGLPPFESVRRARQKIQAKHPELAASEDVQMAKAENEEVYEKYAVT